MLGRFTRTPAVAGTLLLATAALAALAPPAQADPLPPTAVAMGDSFISGEGAGAYVAVTDQNGGPRGSPGGQRRTATPTSATVGERDDPCVVPAGHQPPGEPRLLGAQPPDMAAGPARAPRGVRSPRRSPSCARSRRPATSTWSSWGWLGTTASSPRGSRCRVRRPVRGGRLQGWWEVWIHFANWVTGAELNERACTDADFATATQVSKHPRRDHGRRAAGARRARRGRRRRGPQGRPAGLHQPAAAGACRAVPHEDGRSDTRDKYARSSTRGTPPAARSTSTRSPLPTGSARTSAAWSPTSRRRSRPSARGGHHLPQRPARVRRCPSLRGPGSPGNALATPLRVMDGPSASMSELHANNKSTSSA